MSSKASHAAGLLENHACCIAGTRPRRLTLVLEARIRPPWQPRTAAAALRVAHDVAPFVAIDVAEPVGGRSVACVDLRLMSRPKNVADLVCHRERQKGARMLNDKIGLLRIGGYARGKATLGRIVYDQSDNIGSLVVTQFADTIEYSHAIRHTVEMIKVPELGFDVVDGLRVNEAQVHIADSTIAKRGVDLLNGSGDERSHVEHVAAFG